MLDDTPLVTCTEAAAIFGVSSRTVQRWCNDGLMTATVTAGGHHRIDSHSVMAFAATRQQRSRLRRIGSQPPARSRLLRCLVVEDDRMLAQALSRLLRTLGGEFVDVVCEYDGLGAGLALGRSTPGLLILDIDLPGMDGVALLRRVWPDGIDAGVTVIIDSGKLDVQMRTTLRACGVSEVWNKPLRPDVMRERLHQILEVRQSQWQQGSAG